MNKLEFLTKMRNRLEKFGLPKDDINDALSYYEEVFLDAGFGNEEATSAELGDPEEIADGILRDSGIHTADATEFLQKTEQPQNTGTGKASKSTENFWLKFILLLITFPVWFPLIMAIFAVLFGLLVAVIAIIASLIFSGIALILGGIPLMIDVPPVGILTIGVGLMITGICIMIGKPALNRLIPACGSLIRKFVDWIRSIFISKGGQNNV